MFVAILFICNYCFAGAPQMFTATIASIEMVDDGSAAASSNGTMLVYVYPTGGMPSPPSCATNGPYVSFSMTRPMAKSYLALLMMAQATGKQVFFRTQGACLDQSSSDTLYYFQVLS